MGQTLWGADSPPAARRIIRDEGPTGPKSLRLQQTLHSPGHAGSGVGQGFGP